ncbi:MAG: hypothetical protein E6G94_13785 [Alphaproteobacteria bacterium]|nr:MAG: hypothetical protein E6G94_13785 [Alphaproteobacteria bacterium]
MLKPIPPAIMTLYSDLLQQVETAAQGGALYRRVRDGIEYLYAKTPVGATRVDVFLGRSDDPAARERADSFVAGAAAARSRREIVRVLRRSGFASPSAEAGRLMHALAAADLFERGAVLVGTGAYQLLEASVGSFLPSATLMTGDLDIAAATVAIQADPPEPILAILRRADPSFTDVPQLDHRALPFRFRASSGFLVDLLTPLRTRDDENPVVLSGLEAGAFPAQYLAWLIHGSIRAVALWAAGVPVLVPRPERYAVHKLILSQRRAHGHDKRRKDLAQAGALIAALQSNDPFALEDALEDARAQGAEGWAKPIARSLAELGLDL